MDRECRAVGALAWAPLEFAALMALVAYMLSGSVAALAIAALAVLGLIAMRPGALKRR